jgi:hypothetical protein
VTGNHLAQNTGEHGGGIRVLNAVSTLRDNVVTGNTALLHGGGVSVTISGVWSSPPILVTNLIVSNVAGSNGGGVAAYNSDPAIVAAMSLFSPQVVAGRDDFMRLA